MPELRPVFSAFDARDNILEAALRIFAEKGFHGSSMRDIADNAQVSPGLIHHHFKDKETLWNLVGERISIDFLEQLAHLISPAHVDEKTIPNLLKGYMEYWQAHPSAFRFHLWRVLGSQQEEHKSRSVMLNEKCVPVFAQAQQMGYIRSDVPPGLAMVTAGGLIQYRLYSALEINDAIAVSGHQAPDDDAFIAHVFSLIAPTASTSA
ncbi:TetR/AcrR family transcriptional regulator [Azorhizophilus paspali]|uniref:TetR/AcrR family transcriptional regulator n=1 Tax=Azorhizophilus paspali TaxID=69963 RepID=A0ABV6SMS3_AZOPA